MPKFVYNLQSFLNIKQKLEDQKKMEYGQAIAKLEEEREIKRKIIVRRDAAVAALKAGVSARVDPEEAGRYGDFIDASAKRAKERDPFIKRAEDAVEDRRQALVQAMKERKMLETLKEKKQVEFAKELNLSEQKQTDEVVSYRFNNKE